MGLRFSENNFDLIRLAAALQVAVLHVMSYLSPPAYQSPGLVGSLVVGFFETLPGVPIFFFVSGLLISRSFERSGSLANYAGNRTLRIFPALHVCVLANIAMIAATGYFAAKGVGFFQIALLYAAKTSFFQFYNPGFIRGFGDGVLNGSLWTICVELQFYFLVPLLYRFWRGATGSTINMTLLAVIILSVCCNRLLYAEQVEYGNTVLWKLMRVSFAPWFFMFATGVIVQRNFVILSQWLANRLWLLVIPAYCAFALLMRSAGFSFHNDISPLLFFPLSLTIFISAFALPSLAARVLRGNDLSYGIYIWHVPVMNMFLYYRIGGMGATWIVIVLSVLLAALSWVLVERPCLRLKRRSLHPVLGS